MVDIEAGREYTIYLGGKFGSVSGYISVNFILGIFPFIFSP